MKRLIPLLTITSLIALADDYSFDMDELEQMEVKTYEYNAYIKAEHKYQRKDDHYINGYFAEAFLNYKYFYDNYTLNTEFIANHENIDHEKDDDIVINQLFVNYKQDQNHQLNIGRKTAAWGKGYFFNPIAFIDRKKDPNDPEANRQGYEMINYNYNKVLYDDLQNIALDVVYFKTSQNINDDFYDENSNTIALKTYLLYKDIDIDFAYLYNDKLPNRIGVDFSFNLETNFELHGEYQKGDDSSYSNLIGLKYLTQNDLTITSEYFYQNKQLEKNQSFWDKKYFLNKLSQKEPFDILYLTTYYKNIYNLRDNSYQNSLGLIYSKIKNFDIDFSIGKNSGNKTSEYGSKPIDRYSWLQVKYSF